MVVWYVLCRGRRDPVASSCILGKPVLIRLVNIAPSAHNHIPYRDGGSYSDCREI